MGAHALTTAHVTVPGFTEQVFGGLPRADQRRWAQAYVHGLLTTPGKKSVRRLAEASMLSPAASQSLHQFVNASPWEWMPIRAELTRWITQQMTPHALVIGQAVLRKRGEHSCGVHRRYLPATGRSVTCQVGVGIFLSSYEEAAPVDWRLLLPGSWTKDTERRVRTRIPSEVGFRSVEQHALDLVDTLADTTGDMKLPVVADLESVAGTGTSALVHGLAVRGRDFVVGVPDAFQVAVGRHLRVQRSQDGDGQSLLLTARSLFEFDSTYLTRTERVAARDGRGRPVTVLSHFVRLPQTGPGGERIHRTYRLFAVRPEQGRRPVQLWLTSLTHARMESLLALTQTLTHAGEAVREMGDDIGLLDFEGRSYPGWHHHMTMVSAAYAHSRFGQRTVRGRERTLVAA